MKLKDVTKRTKIPEYYIPGTGAALFFVVKALAGKETVLVFKDKVEPELYVYFPVKKLNKLQMKSEGSKVEEASGHRLVYVAGVNLFNYANFLNDYTDKYMVSMNYYKDYVWN
jgi:hypothetical protein